MMTVVTNGDDNDYCHYSEHADYHYGDFDYDDNDDGSLPVPDYHHPYHQHRQWSPPCAPSDERSRIFCITDSTAKRVNEGQSN